MITVYNYYIMLSKKIPFYYSLLTAILGAVLVFLALRVTNLSNNTATASSLTSAYKSAISGVETPSNNCGTKMVRLAGFNYINPLLYTDKDCESPDLDYLKNDLETYIESEKAKGILSTASVYIRVFSKAQWTSINADENYHPASLNKLPILITYLHMAENSTNLLEQKLFFKKHDSTLPVQYYTAKTLRPDQYYTLKELLHAMIAYSDNDATLLLLQHINLDYYNKTFTDLGMAKPSFDFDKFFVNTRQYSLFLRILYNGTYLSDGASEYGMSLLAECNFKEGLLKKLPSSVKAAHKFGESGYGNTYELHESGIIYAGQNTYLITVMTKGKDWKDLSEVISNISNITYGKLNSNS